MTDKTIETLLDDHLGYEDESGKICYSLHKWGKMRQQILTQWRELKAERDGLREALKDIIDLSYGARFDVYGIKEFSIEMININKEARKALKTEDKS